MSRSPEIPIKRRRLIIGLMATLVSIAVALIVNTLWVDSRTRDAAPWDGGHIVETDIEPANVKVEGDGPPILLIHGFGASIDWWDEMTPLLAAHHRVIRIDLIGHGGTAAPAAGYEITRQAQLAAAILDKLGVDRVTVIGHSMGGEVAVALAGLEQERIERIILIDSPATADADFTFLTEAYLIPVIGEALSHFRSNNWLRRGLAQAFAPNFVVPKKFVRDIKQLTYTAFRTAHNESIAYRTVEPLVQRLAKLKPVPPVLVIFGSLDAIVPAEHARLFERVPGAKIKMVDGVGHSPIVEAPAQTLQLIEEFIESSL